MKLIHVHKKRYRRRTLWIYYMSYFDNWNGTFIGAWKFYAQEKYESTLADDRRGGGGSRRYVQVYIMRYITVVHIREKGWMGLPVGRQWKRNTRPHLPKRKACVISVDKKNLENCYREGYRNCKNWGWNGGKKKTRQPNGRESAQGRSKYLLYNNTYICKYNLNQPKKTYVNA